MNTRLILAGLLLAGGAIVALVGAAPQAALSPSQALAASPDGAHVAVKGMVESVDPQQRTFTLTDGENTLLVHLPYDLPARATPGTALVAEGRLAQEEGQVVLQASEIVIGCPSKYEA